MHYRYRKVKIQAQNLKDKLLITAFYWHLPSVVSQKRLPCH